MWAGKKFILGTVAEVPEDNTDLCNFSWIKSGLRLKKFYREEGSCYSSLWRTTRERRSAYSCCFCRKSTTVCRYDYDSYYSWSSFMQSSLWCSLTPWLWFFLVYKILWGRVKCVYTVWLSESLQCQNTNFVIPKFWGSCFDFKSPFHS